MKAVKKQKRSKNLIYLIALLIAIPLTIAFSQQPQILQQFAQGAPPPLFYCLVMGQSNNKDCASLSFEPKTGLSLQLRGKELIDPSKKKTVHTVYYGDTLTGSTSYANNGDLALYIRNLGITAQSGKSGTRTAFSPAQQNVTVPPGQSTTLAMTSHTFNAPDPGGITEVFSTVTDANGQVLDDPDTALINVDTTCTPFRAKPLTERDKNVLRTICQKTPDSPACRQFCQVDGDESCRTAPKKDVPPAIGQPNPGDGSQCNVGTGKPNGCSCTNNSQCFLKICTDGKCAADRAGSQCNVGTGKPNGCGCSTDAQCALKICNAAGKCAASRGEAPPRPVACENTTGPKLPPGEDCSLRAGNGAINPNNTVCCSNVCNRNTLKCN